MDEGVIPCLLSDVPAPGMTTDDTEAGSAVCVRERAIYCFLFVLANEGLEGTDIVEAVESKDGRELLSEAAS